MCCGPISPRCFSPTPFMKPRKAPRLTRGFLRWPPAWEGSPGGWLSMRLIRAGMEPVAARTRVVLFSAIGCLITVAIPFAPSTLVATLLVGASYFATLAGTVNVYTIPAGPVWRGRCRDRNVRAGCRVRAVADFSVAADWRAGGPLRLWSGLRAGGVSAVLGILAVEAGNCVPLSYILNRRFTSAFCP